MRLNGANPNFKPYTSPKAKGYFEGYEMGMKYPPILRKGNNNNIIAIIRF
jgi:hypothetical protein